MLKKIALNDAVTVLVFALRACDTKCFVMVARKMVETWTTVKNTFFFTKTIHLTKTQSPLVCLGYALLEKWFQITVCKKIRKMDNFFYYAQFIFE